MKAESIQPARLRRACALLSLSLCLVACAAPAAAAQGGWIAERGGEAGKDLNAVYFVGDKRGWIGGDGGQVWRTEDGGRTWARQQTGVEESVNDIYFRDKEDGYLLAGNKILLTEDGGATWRAAHTFASAEFGGASPELYSVRFASKKRGWVVGSVSRGDNVVDSLLLYTDDGGSSWLRRTTPVSVELLHLDFDGE